jgi:hypothetical protein
LYAAQVDRVLGLGLVVVLLVAEALVIAASLGSPQARSAGGMGLVFARVLINAIPAVAGIRGYFVARRLSSEADTELKNAPMLWVSRQFLTVAVFAYAAVIIDVIRSR